MLQRILSTVTDSFSLASTHKILSINFHPYCLEISYKLLIAMVTIFTAHLIARDNLIATIINNWYLVQKRLHY